MIKGLSYDVGYLGVGISLPIKIPFTLPLGFLPHQTLPFQQNMDFIYITDVQSPALEHQFKFTQFTLYYQV